MKGLSIATNRKATFAIHRLGICSVVLSCLLISLDSQAQFKGDDIPGFLGLQSGTQAPPGLYIGNSVWVYPTDTLKDNNGNTVNQRGSLTSVASLISVTFTSNFKVLGGNYGAAVAIPFIQNRLQFNSLAVNSSFAFTDMFVTPISLGWSAKRADFIAAYNLYLPTGRFSNGAINNTGLGMYGNEVSVGTTVYPDQKKMWNAAVNFSAEFHTNKRGTNINVGDIGTVQGGVGRTFYKKVSGPVPMITNVGVAAYSQFKITGDSGSDIPPALQGFKDRVFGVGPEINTFIPKPRLTLLFRWEPEFGARNRTQGQTFVISIVWLAKSLVKKHA